MAQVRSCGHKSGFESVYLFTFQSFYTQLGSNSKYNENPSNAKFSSLFPLTSQLGSGWEFRRPVV